MKRGSTLFLRKAVVFIGLLALGLCAFVLSIGIGKSSSGMYRSLLLGMYVPAIPFFAVLYQAMKILGHIDSNKAFSELFMRALKKVKHYAAAIGLLYAVGAPYIYYVANMDNAAGVMALGLIIIFASMVVAVFVAVLHRLLGDALAIKPEHDLTV